MCADMDSKQWYLMFHVLYILTVLIADTNETGDCSLDGWNECLVAYCEIGGSQVVHQEDSYEIKNHATCGLSCTDQHDTFLSCSNGKIKKVDNFEISNRFRRKNRKKRFFGIIIGIVCIFARCRRPRDRVPPILNCPQDIERIADSLKYYTRIWWTEPQAVDKKDGRVRTNRRGSPPGSSFSEGVNSVGYYARDRSGNMARCSFSIKIKVLRCPKLHQVKDGTYLCNQWTDMIRGSVCRFRCYKGHELEGPSSVNCHDTGIWSAAPPICRKIKCHPHHLPKHSQLQMQCTDTTYYRSICKYSCAKGYDIPITIPRARVCTSSRRWSGSDVTCVDVQPPAFIDCIDVLIFYTRRSNDTAIVQWSVPKVTDNVDVFIAPVQRQGPRSLTFLKAGVYNVVYSASDKAGNQAKECKMKIIVKDVRCQQVFPTPYLSVVCSGTRYGSFCNFDCRDGTVLNGSNSAQCERRGNPPYGYWTYEGYQPFCERVERCQSLSPPNHGALACDYWMGGRFCQIFCKSGYDLPATYTRDSFPELIVCSDEGSWSYDKQLPSCMRSTVTKSSTAIMKWYFYFDGDCQDQLVHADIQLKFIEALKASPFGFLCESPECNWHNVQVKCGKNRRKRSENKQELVVSMDLIIGGSNTITKESYLTQSRLYSSIKDLFSNNWSMENNTLDISLENRVELMLSSFSGSSLEIQCPENTVRSYSSMTCVECEAGSYYDKEYQVCKLCPLGHFQSASFMDKCIPCPESQTTRFEGATHQNNCTEACLPGFWSTNGVPPCTPCNIAMYQNTFGSTECIQCPAGTTTENDGSASMEQCKAFDITFPMLNDTLLVLPDVVVVDSTFVVSFRAKCLGECKGTLFSIGTGGHDSAISAVFVDDGLEDDNRSVILSGSNYSDNRWHGFVFVFTPDETYVYADSILVLNSTNLKSTRMEKASLHIGKHFVGSISGFNIYNTTDDIDTFVTSTEKCGSKFNGDIVDWQNLTNAILNGAFIEIPSLCDDEDECKSGPCLNCSCVDALGNYTCICKDGFIGRNCDTNIDDCIANSCQNQASCVDGVNGYTCLCQPHFTGIMCEIVVVDGKWSNWGEWSDCSATCANGTKTRQRKCTNPAPDNGGNECQGNMTDTVQCYVTECRICSTLTAPDNSILKCAKNESEDLITCTLECEDGYDFDVAPPEIYTCGRDTFHLWDFQSESNVNGRLPSCSRIIEVDDMDAVHHAAYIDLYCHQHSYRDIQQEVSQNVLQAAQNVSCVQNSLCTLKGVTVGSCDFKQKQKRSTGQPASFKVTFGCRPKEIGTVECYKALTYAILELREMASNLSLLTTMGDRQYYVDTNNTFADNSFACPEGSVPVIAYCVQCGVGKYFENEECKACPYGTYQNEEGQTTCKKCPSGTTTPGDGSINIEDCSEYLKVPEKDLAFTTIMISVAIGFFLLGIVIGIACYRKNRYSNKIGNVNSIFPPIRMEMVHKPKFKASPKVMD